MVQKWERDEKESIRHLPYFFIINQMLDSFILVNLGDFFFNNFYKIPTE